MNAEDFANKQPMAMPGFTVLTPKHETAHDKSKQPQTHCTPCGGERPAYSPLSATQDVPTETGKKNGKR